jgi:transcriptional/translational regulatory protein YebC/TACO1
LTATRTKKNIFILGRYKAKSGIKIRPFPAAWLAKEEIEGDEKIKEQNQRFMNALNDNDSVQEVYSNLKDYRILE